MSEHTTNRVLGVDLGAIHTGLAITDALRMLAHPFATIHANSVRVTTQRISRIIMTEQISEVVLGLPRNMDGTHGVAVKRTHTFAKLLMAHVKCPIHFWDERWTTVAAQQALRKAGKRAKACKAIVNQVAAQILLQSWLDAQSFRL